MLKQWWTPTRTLTSTTSSMILKTASVISSLEAWTPRCWQATWCRITTPSHIWQIARLHSNQARSELQSQTSGRRFCSNSKTGRPHSMLRTSFQNERKPDQMLLRHPRVLMNINEVSERTERPSWTHQTSYELRMRILPCYCLQIIWTFLPVEVSKGQLCSANKIHKTRLIKWWTCQELETLHTLTSHWPIRTVANSEGRQLRIDLNLSDLRCRVTSD